MAVYEKKLGLMEKMIVMVFSILERTIMKKRMFKIVINLLNRMKFYYVTKLITPDMMELIG
ncbi:MAG: hypothetical protein ACTSRP_04785 [Candidatus Helarchaeota archaeon]